MYTFIMEHNNNISYIKSISRSASSESSVISVPQSASSELSVTSEPQCRICGLSAKDLYIEKIELSSPCNCAPPICRECLQVYVNVTKKSSCEICAVPYLRSNKFDENEIDADDLDEAFHRDKYGYVVVNDDMPVIG